MITEVDKKIVAALNKGEEYWTFKEDAERDYVHGLFAYPAMMVPKMQREILDVFDHQLAWSHTPTIYDPFMGSGTILVEGMLKGYNIVGVDINPLAYLVAKVKTEIYSLNRLRKSINVLFERIKNTNDVEVATDFDNIQKWFKPEIIRELDLIKQQIRLEPSLKFRRLMWVAFCDTVRLVSNARSCTYKLYIKTQKSIDNFDKSAIDMFYECLESAYTGIASFQQELQNKGFLKKMVAAYLILVYKDNSLEIKLSFDDGITYNLQRESRLAEMFMDDILKRYSDYHSRKALDYDFGTEYCDVLRDICTYRIPLGTIQGLKVRQNQKFSMENGASMSISNERITFTFPKDVEHTFFYAAALDQKVSFSLVASPKLTLTIAYE